MIIQKSIKAFLLLLLLASSAFADPTPNMGLELPLPTVTPGPDWAQDINDAFDLVDAHDHSSGKGKRVTPSGLNINADLSIGSNSLTATKSLNFTEQSSGITGAGKIYDYNGDLYFNNGAGVAVKVTSGSAVNNSITGAFATTVPGAYPYTVSASDAQKVILVSTASARTINLPAATTAVFFAVKDVTGSAGSNNITIVRNGSNTIDGVSGNKTLDVNYGWWWLISDGVSNWSTAFSPQNLKGTANQITVTSAVGATTLSLPQDIATSSTPTFAGLNSSGNILPTTSTGKNLGNTSGPSLWDIGARQVLSANQDITIGTTTGHDLVIKTQNSNKWKFEADGDLAGDSSNGGNIVFQKAGSSVTYPAAATQTAGGTNCSNATQLTNLQTVIATGSGTAKLYNSGNGVVHAVYNGTVGAVGICPPTGQAIAGAGGPDVAVSVPSFSSKIFIKIDTGGGAIWSVN